MGNQTTFGGPKTTYLFINWLVDYYGVNITWVFGNVRELREYLDPIKKTI